MQSIIIDAAIVILYCTTKDINKIASKIEKGSEGKGM